MNDIRNTCRNDEDRDIYTFIGIHTPTQMVVTVNGVKDIQEYVVYSCLGNKETQAGPSRPVVKKS